MPTNGPLAVAVSVLLTAAAVAQPPRDAKPGDSGDKPLIPVVVLDGSHSRVTKEAFAVARTADEWKRLWAKHHGGEGDRRFAETHQTLAIDFDTHVVVAVFCGKGSGESCRVTPRQREGAVVIGYKAMGVQTGAAAGLGTGNCEPPAADKAAREKAVKEKRDAEAPYAFVVLRKPVGKVVIEQDVSGLINGPPVWKEREVFAEPGEKK